MTLMRQVQAVHTQRRQVAITDWSRIQRLYAFCRARAIERIIAVEDGATKQRRDLATLESMYGKARQHNDIVIECAATYFRAQALRDAQHPDFRGEWL